MVLRQLKAHITSCILFVTSGSEAQRALCREGAAGQLQLQLGREQARHTHVAAALYMLNQAWMTPPRNSRIHGGPPPRIKMPCANAHRALRGEGAAGQLRLQRGRRRRGHIPAVLPVAVGPPARNGRRQQRVARLAGHHGRRVAVLRSPAWGF